MIVIHKLRREYICKWNDTKFGEALLHWALSFVVINELICEYTCNGKMIYATNLVPTRKHKNNGSILLHWKGDNTSISFFSSRLY